MVADHVRWVINMTLIIAAISKNGVFIRSDKRRTVKNALGLIQCFDDMTKVFISSDKRTIIYNHGINIINNKSWYDLAIRSEKDIQHNGSTNIDAALDKIENAISADIQIELSNNQLDNLCAFVVILKTRSKSSNKWESGEISWRHGQSVEKSRRGRFLCSGSGTKYVRPNKKHKEDSHWASIRLIEAKMQIGKLYANAIQNQNNAHGNEFSPTYDDMMQT